MNRDEIEKLLNTDFVSAEECIVKDVARTALDALARLEDAEAAQALVVEQVEKAIKATVLRLGQHPDIKRIMAPQVMWGAGDSCITAIRALADPSGVSALAALRARAEKAESERVSEWNRRRDADGSRDAARAACDSMRAERDDAITRLAALAAYEARRKG